MHNLQLAFQEQLWCNDDHQPKSMAERRVAEHARPQMYGVRRRAATDGARAACRLDHTRKQNNGIPILPQKSFP